MKHHTRSLTCAPCLAVLFAFSACASVTKQEQLAAVAKDWSMVIRASQVMPVYPLTEDLHPGDVFLVQTSIDKQHEIYNDKGFLPLDNLIARLDPKGYVEFYAKSFRVGDDAAPLPQHWLRPGETKTLAWASAPQAGFPTYSFSVKRGVGFSGALPVKGVPVGLSLLGTDTADGSITIDQARTYGVDTMSLYQQLEDWAQMPANKQFLRHFAPGPNKTNYLRVVTRIYLTGRLLVTLVDTSSRATEGSAGARKPMDLFLPQIEGNHHEVTTERYTEGLKKIDRALSEALRTVDVGGESTVLPGATLRVVAASSRSITTSETFIDRPLVIGYLGFDVAIGEDGKLGPPIPTHSVVEQKAVPAGVFSDPEVRWLRLRDTVDRDGRVEQIYARAATRLPPEWKSTFDQQFAQFNNAKAAFRAAHAEWSGTPGALQTALSALSAAAAEFGIR